jgi:tRNA wybutosine-synthesizing protein 4
MMQYYNDPFIREMEPKKSHKKYLPLINRGTWSRAFAIENSVSKVLSSVKENNPTANVNIINIGSGYDTLYFTLKNKNFTNFKYFEFDYSEITEKKIELIKKSKLLQSAFIEVKISGENLYSADYNIIDCDITNVDKMREKLSNLEINFSDMTIVIAECVLVYIKKETTYEILTKLNEVFPNLVLFEYDLTNANDAFGREMVENLENRNVRLFGYEDVPYVASQIERLIDTGFKFVEVYDMLEYYNTFIDKNERKRIEHLEMMDEFEEWNMMQIHACFGYGAKLQSDYEYIKDVIKIKK